jgi:hypothetical protein
VIAHHSWGGQGPSGFASHDRSAFPAPEEHEYARLRRRHSPFCDSFLSPVDSAAKVRRNRIYESRSDRRLVDREELSSFFGASGCRKCLDVVVIAVEVKYASRRVKLL